LNPKSKIPKISSSKTVQIESEMMGVDICAKTVMKVELHLQTPCLKRMKMNEM